MVGAATWWRPGSASRWRPSMPAWPGATAGGGITYATPSVVFGTAVSSGAASSTIRSDATLGPPAITIPNADPTGVADSSAAIVAFINGLAAGSYTVLPGNYKLAA